MFCWIHVKGRAEPGHSFHICPSLKPPVFSIRVDKHTPTSVFYGRHSELTVVVLPGHVKHTEHLNLSKH